MFVAQASEAISHARMASLFKRMGVTHCFAVAGQPITQLAEECERVLERFEWAVNEKVAVEAAVGLSIVGEPTVCIFKQCGVNAAADALINAAAHSIGAGMVIVVGDDLDSSKSTVLQDTREMSEILRVPVIDPVGVADLGNTLAAAFSLSEKISSPVIVRLAGGLVDNDLNGGDSAAESQTVSARENEVFDPNVAQGLTKLGRVQRRRLMRAVELEHLRHWLPPFIWGMGGSKEHARRRYLAVGSAAAFAPPASSCLILKSSLQAYQKDLDQFFASPGEVMVLEQPLPFAEAKLRDIYGERVIGRLSGHLPPEGALSRTLLDRDPSWGGSSWNATPTAKSAGSRAGSVDGYGPLFEALGELRSRGIFVAADVGSSVNLCYPPYSASEVAICLGSAISVASGAARAGRPSVAVIGDFGLFHSALPSLVDVFSRQLPVTVVVLVNGVQAKTGGQPSLPGKASAAGVAHRVASVVTGCGIERIDVVGSGQTRDSFLSKLEAILGASPGVLIVVDGELNSAQDEMQ